MKRNPSIWAVLVLAIHASDLVPAEEDKVNVTFSAGRAPESTVNAVALCSGGKISVGGAFGRVGGQGRNGIARLNSDGTLDTGLIHSLASQACPLPRLATRWVNI